MPSVSLKQYPLPDLESYVRRITVCLPSSHYPRQVSATVGKFLWFTEPQEPDDIWSRFHDVRLVDKWYDSQTEKGLKPSTLYNIITCLLLGADYCYTVLGRAAPEGFIRHLKQLRRKQSRERKASEQDLLEEQGLLGVPDLRPFIAMLKRRSVLREFTAIYDRSCAIRSGEQKAPLRKTEYLFAMRLCLSYVMASSAARTSATYSLTLTQVHGACGNWKGKSPVLFRNNKHKTSSTSGHARFAVSGVGKSLLSMFVLSIRKTFLSSNGLQDCIYLFVDSAGKQLTSSSVAKHLLAFQASEGFKIPYTPTMIRKCICSQMKSPQARNLHLDMTVASGLLHTVETSQRHYTLGHRDSVALKFHQAIVRFYGL